MLKYQPAGLAVIRVMSAASAVTVRENVTPPPVSVRSPALMPVLITTGPFTPVAPSWMCAMLSCVVAGQPATTTSNFALVPVRVTVALPAQLASASAIGGFWFVALSSALKVFAGVGAGVGVGVGATVGAVVGLSVGVGDAAVVAPPPQAAIAMAAAARHANRRIPVLLWTSTR